MMHFSSQCEIADFENIKKKNRIKSKNKIKTTYSHIVIKYASDLVTTMDNSF